MPKPGDLVLGIDTSAYTTSVALLDGAAGRIVREARAVVPVPPGERGRRPADVVFHHVTHLPGLLRDVLGDATVVAVSVSERPRPVAESYLPTFLAGVLAAEAVAQGAHVPCFRTTHQEGHMAAGRLDAAGPDAEWFWALHVSGGTTELLRVHHRRPGDYALQQVGGTSDLYAGQLVDRVGVRLGLPFPAGAALEVLAQEARDRLVLPVGAPAWRNGLWVVSFSGPEAHALRAIAAGVEPAAVARAVEEAVARGLAKLVRAASAGQEGPLLLVGGVAANHRVRRILAERLGPSYPLYCASPDHSRDNAVGVALIGWERWTAERDGAGLHGPDGQ
jgi:N6-L-threonylcarbamoyladenine synthase